MNVDLHCHSVISDGTLEPERLAQRAHTNGVTLWALTDHDEIGGQHRAAQTALSLGMSYLTGTEISVSFAGQTVHIVGLGFDAEHPVLVEGLRHTRSGRKQRALDIAQSLETQANLAGTFEGALAHVGNPELMSRTHFARHLIERGVCSDARDVFRRYLTEGKPGFVPHRWAKLGEAVSWITQAGGIAVIAHPARYRFTPNEEYALFSEFKTHGGEAVEVVTGSHTASEAARYANTALEFGLLASRGSDFHCPMESQTDLGKLPALPKKVRPVWEALLDRIQAP